MSENSVPAVDSRSFPTDNSITPAARSAGEMEANLAFKELPAHRHSGRKTGNIGTVKAHTNNRGIVRFAIAQDVIVAIGSPIFVRLLIGDAADKNRLAILPAVEKDSGATRLWKQKGGLQINVSVAAHRIGVPEVKRRTTSLPFDLSAQRIVVDLRPLAKPHVSLAA